MVQPAVGRKKHDDGEDDDFEIVGKGAVPHPPDFKFAFVGSDDGVVEVVAVAVYLIEDGFFVAEDDRGDAGEAWGDFVDFALNRVRIEFVMAPCLWTWANDAHLANKDVDKLGKLVDLGFAQEFAHGEDARIVLLCEHAARQVGAIFEHGGEFEDLEVFAAFANAWLQVKNIVLSSELEPNHNGNHKRKEHHDSEC